ncbi:MAG TPA: GGDEF domain-containing protein [Candidatus Eisenbacteria bacterium]|nr:GGDEF domain-containing protein [Candidatus Eisenbacteria bacterium]
MASPDDFRRPPDRDAEAVSRQQHIDFRELLERILPLHELPAMDRFRVQAALKGNAQADLEEAALLALSRLEQRGALERLPSDTGALRYRRRDALDVISVELPGMLEEDGVRAVPRATLPAEATTTLDQLRRLLRLDDALLVGDPGSGQARTTLLGQLTEAARAVLGVREVRFVARGEPAVDPALAARARHEAHALLYCPDVRRSRALEALAARGVRAAVLAGVPGGGAEPAGHLEVLANAPDPFRPEDLALVALLADACGGALERAARIEKLVFVDPLTSVYNRAYFDRQLENEMARVRRDGSSMALAIADIDDFKSFNTRYGYEAGNRVLVQVAERLRHALRPFDTVARWGGEEFAIVLTAPVSADDVRTICERLRTMVEHAGVALEGLERDAHEVSVTISMGVALYPDHGDTAAELWRAANRALLIAKRPPKNQVVFFSA